MSAPDCSPNYNAALEVHQPGTGSWFLDGADFDEWVKISGSVLWLYGGRKLYAFTALTISHALLASGMRKDGAKANYSISYPYIPLIQ